MSSQLAANSTQHLAASIGETRSGCVGSVGRASDHTKARNFLKLPFIATANFALWLVVSPELLAIRPKNDLLARRLSVGCL